MKSIAIIACYIGKPNNYFGLWIKSVAANPTIDFYIVGQMDLSAFNLPPNLKIKEMTLQELEQTAKEKLNEPTATISVPYKTGDYRPMFGEMFQDWLKDYDEWGYCDTDVIFGDLRQFLTDEKLEKYDKIYPVGHLSLYKNTPEVNRRWRLPDARYDYHQVISSPEVFAFDEWRGIHNIYMRNKFPFYRTVEFASPCPDYRWRYLFKDRSDPRYEPNPKNYRNMCFYWEDGHLFRAYETDVEGKPRVVTDEFAYMHFQLRRFSAPAPEVYGGRAFFCAPFGFIPKEYVGTPPLADVKRYNPMPWGCPAGEWCYLVWTSFTRWLRRRFRKLTKQKAKFASREGQIMANRSW